MTARISALLSPPENKVDRKWSAPDFPFAWCGGLGEVVAPAGNGRQCRSLTGKSQLLSMAEALSRLIPNADGSLILVIRHRQVCRALPFLGLVTEIFSVRLRR